MTLTLTRPDDWHIHLRDGDALSRTVVDAARVMGRAIVMPNLGPPVATTSEAQAYHQRILEHRPEGSAFEPLMTLYLTDETTPEEIGLAAQSGIVQGVKLYPAGATTNSASGVTDIRARYPIFEALSDHGLKLLVHGEVTDPAVDIFDREAVFLDTVLADIVQRFPRLGVVLEHITTSDAVAFVREGPPNLAATITAHHLLYNRNHMLVGGIRPHYYCLPVLKRRTHQEALIEAATSGEPRFFLGTDSAPHTTDAKESACGCAGSYTAHAALEFYAEAFDGAGCLERLEGFASHFGADFYGLPRNRSTVTLERSPWVAPDTLPMGDGRLRPLGAGETLAWRVVDS
jgi:dihydroorotase